MDEGSIRGPRGPKNRTQIFVVVFLFQKNHLHLWDLSNICCYILILKKHTQIFVAVFLFKKNHLHLWDLSNICCYILVLKKHTQTFFAVFLFKKNHLHLWDYSRSHHLVCVRLKQKEKLFCVTCCSRFVAKQSKMIFLVFVRLFGVVILSHCCFLVLVTSNTMQNYLNK